MSGFYVGLMSGTSMDGIDAALVRFGDASIEELTTREHPYSDELKNRLREAITQSGLRTVDDVAHEAGTISYEILTGLTGRLPRIWVEAS